MKKAASKPVQGLRRRSAGDIWHEVMELLERGEITTALKTLDRALKGRARVEMRLHTLRGNVLEVLGRPREALVEHNLVLAANPRNTLALQDCGDCYLSIRQYAKAAKYYRRLLRALVRTEGQPPRGELTSDARIGLAEALSELGRHRSAGKLLVEILATNPLDAFAIKRLQDVQTKSQKKRRVRTK